EFAKGDGGMVKRLHLGRASEAGVLAASLAEAGFTGPRTVLEGQFGFLRVFCTEFDEAELTKGLGRDFVTTSTVLKRYPVHATAHAAVRAVPEAGSGHGSMGSTVAVTLSDGRRLESHVDSGLLEPGELPDKFTRLTRGALGESGAARLFARLQKLEDETNLDWLGKLE